MKLRNKKTGEIKEIFMPEATTLKEFCDIYEDYEEPKNQYYLDCDGRIFEHHTTEYTKNKMKEIGNYFETKEEAEKAVEKLKAFKRLKDKGFRFTGYTHKDRGRLDELEIYCQLGECPENIEEMDDVHLLFGVEE